MTNQSQASTHDVFFASQLIASKNSGSRSSISSEKAARRGLAWVRGVLFFAMAWMLLGASCLSGHAQVLLPSWNQQSPATSPSARFAAAIAYDAGHNQVVMFGGYGGTNDTWLWNGSTWSQANPATSPSARGDLSMVYDAAHGQVVMFGGLDPSSSNRLNDTWLWDGTNWSQPSLSNSPPARDGSYMAYDSAHGQVVMFGGVDAGGSELNDTWLWNGTTWTQANPSTNPGARSGHVMAYDSAHGQVVLFGGQDPSLNYLIDTWTWDGVNWTQQSPPNSPPGREAAGMAYNAALGEAILFGGAIGSGGNIDLNDTWAWNGSNWTEQGPLGSGPSARIATSNLTYDSALGQVILFSGDGTTADTWEWGLPGNFSNVNVCPSGQTTPAPCSSALSFVYETSGTSFGPTQVVTQGVTGLDFTLATGSTCVGSVGAGTCTVNVTFTPQAPGLRMGAIQLTNATTGSVIATTPIYGNGQGPAVAFGPGAQTTLTNSLAGPKQVAVDAAGDVFVADDGNNRVLELPAGGGAPVSLGSGLSGPWGVAVDGAGNLFIADRSNNRVVEVPAGCITAACQTTVGSGLLDPSGVGVDGAGNVFIADSSNSRVVEVPPGCTSAACQTTVGSGLSNPLGVTADVAGDVFIADSNNNRVLEIPAGCTTAACQTTVGSGFNNPREVTVDAAGDVFVADVNNSRVVEIPAGCIAAACQTTVGSGFMFPTGVAVDGAGNLFIADTNDGQLAEVNRSQPPTLNFDTAFVGSFSDDSPKSLTLQNIGNQPLSHIAPGLIANSTGFSQTLGNSSLADCTSTFSLVAGAECNLSISFRPTFQATFGSVAVFTDNALNANPAQQVINLYGTGLNPPVTFTLTGAGTGNGSVSSSPSGINCNVLGGIASGTCSASFTGGSTIGLQEIPSPGYTFAGWGGACASSGTNQQCIVTVNSASSASASFVPTVANYALTITEVGAGTGTVSDSLAQISCSEAGGVVSGTCSSGYASGAIVTLTAAPSGTSIFTGWGGACASSGTNPICNVSMLAAENVTASFVNQSFGNVNVCPAGQSTPAPCSANMPVTISLAADTTIGAINVVTQGATGLDFNPGSGSTCVGTIAAGNSCSVNVNFTPLAPGLRMGAIQIYDNSANLITTTPIYGVGQAPLIAFGPGSQTIVPTTGLHYNVGTAVDALGNLYIADYVADKVVKVTPDGVQTTVPTTGLTAPIGVAVDGAGNIFIADLNLPNAVKVSPAGVQTTVGTGLGRPIGIAVDGAGNAYIADQNNIQVVKVTPGGVQSVVPFTGLSKPNGVAVDSQGDVFVSDNNNNLVVEYTVGGLQVTLPIAGLSDPYGLAVDAAGNLYIADGFNNRVIQYPAGGGALTTVATGLNFPSGVSVDAAGNVFIGDQGSGEVLKISRSQAPALSFATTNAGSTSADSPQAITVQNIGNQPVTGSLALNLGGNFTQNATPDCSGSFPLAPGAVCGETFSFTPQSATFFSGTAIFTDNSLNIATGVQAISLSGTGAIGGVAGTVAVPNVVGQVQAAATTPITGAGLAMGTVTATSSETVPSGSIISQNPAAGTQVNVGSIVNLLVSTGLPQPLSPNPLVLNNNYFVTGDYVSSGVTLRGTGTHGMATGNITIPTYASSPTQGVPDGADVVEAYLYWETLENTASASSTSGTFNNYSIVGQQIGTDQPGYIDGTFTGTIRAYRAEVNAYLPVGANGIRFAAGNYTVSLPDGGSQLPLTEGASLVLIYRVLSPNFPLKSVVIYDGSALPTGPAVQVVQGFYDAVGGASGTGKNTNLFASGGSWNNSVSSVTLGQSNQYTAPLSIANAYAAVILSTPVNNSDNDGILDAWKAGPAAGDFHAGQPGYYDVKTNSWVGLPGAKHGQKDLFVQLDYMCGAVLANGSCDPTQENLFPSPDASGNDPLAMVQQAFAASGVQLHLQVGNAVPESTCTDDPTNPSALCQFPGQPGVISWKNGLEFSKLWPRNFASCAAGGDCTTRFPYGQKDSYHYVLFGHSLAIPAWNTRYGTLASINVVNGVTTIVTADRGAGISACPGRITLSGVLGNPSLNGVYNTASCSDTKTITVATPGVPNWSYPNSTLPEPVIGLTSGTITSISGYSDLGGADSAVTLGLWLTAPNQDMSKRANVLAGTLFHEIGHTLGLSHGGLYYDTPSSYVPTFEANCKPNYQSIMNYLFQLDGVGPNQAIAFSNQTLTTLNESTAGSVTQLTDLSNAAATFPTSAWYVPYTTASLATPATRHCDGTPLIGDAAYRVDASIAPITPAWANGQDINFIGALQTKERGYNDLGNLDLRQIGATGGEFASLASVLSFGSSAAPLNIAAGGNVALGSGGTIALGSGGNVTLGSGGNVTLGSGGTITLGSGGNVTLGSGGNVTLGSGGTITPGSSGNVTLGSGGNVTLGSGGTITLGSGGTIALGSGGNVTLGSGGTIALGSGGTVTIPSTGGSYSIDDAGGTITLGSGGNVTLGSGGNVTLGSGGTIALGSGGNITLGSGGNVTLGSGGTIALGSGGTIALGSGGNVTLGSGGTIALGSGGNITLGSGGNVTLGSGGTVTLGSGGNVALGSGGNITLGSGGSASLGAGGTVTLGSGGNVTLGSGGTVTLGSGGNVTLGSGGTIALGSGGNITLGSGGTIALGSGGTVTDGGVTTSYGPGSNNISVGAGGTITLGSGGNVTLGSGGNVTLGSGGNITLGSGGNIALGSGGTITLGSGGNVTLGSGGVVTLGSGGSVTPGNDADIPVSTNTVTNTATQGSGGPLSNELTYETANSVVRVPTAPTETPTPAGVRVTWKAPAFGVVQTYTIYRSSNGATPIVIGSVSGVNGNPPATEFTDTNPDLVSQTVVYTVTTTLVPDTQSAAPRQSQQSAPAVLKNDQTITLGPLPSSVLITAPPTITATAMSSGVPNGLQVVFGATGSCSIGSQTIVNNVSSATVTLNNTGSCTVSASQPGSTAFNAANAVSGTFMVLPQGSGTQSQTITFALLPNVQYGNSFSLSASSSSGLQVSFTASGPCATNGSISGIGVCSITASAPASNTYSAASQTQSFTIFPAVLKVTANNLNTAYGQPLPSLTYAYSGFVMNDTAAVVSGVPALSTTATATSNIGSYPITVSTGTLATANYSFLYVSGTLNVQLANQAALTLKTTSPLTFNQSETLSVTGGTSGGAVTYNLIGGLCTLNGNQLTAKSGTGSCQVTATMAGNGSYGPVTSAPANTVTLAQASSTISISDTPASALYGGSFTPTYSYFGNGTPMVTSSTTSVCKVSGTQVSFVGVGTCTLTASAAATTNYLAATGSAQSFTVDEAPAITSAVSTTFTVGTAGTFTVTTTGYPAATITETGALPAGLTFINNNNGTGTLSGKATVGGIYPITFVAQNGVGSTATQSFTLTAEANVPASSTTCNGVYIGTFSGSIMVSNGQNCIFKSGGVSGSITETGGNLNLSGATIGGSVQVNGGTYSIGPSTTIKGSLTVQSIPKGSAQNQICGTSVAVNLVLQSVGTAAVIGSGTASCPANTIGGSVTLQANTAAIGLTGNIVKGSLTDQSNSAATTLSGNTVSGSLTDQGNGGATVLTANLISGNLVVQSNTASSVLSLNTVGANLTDQGNTGPAQVSSNKVTGTLLCQSNTSITGSGNTASKKQGQCSTF